MWLKSRDVTIQMVDYIGFIFSVFVVVRVQDSLLWRLG